MRITKKLILKKVEALNRITGVPEWADEKFVGYFKVCDVQVFRTEKDGERVRYFTGSIREIYLQICAFISGHQEGFRTSKRIYKGISDEPEPKTDC